jgi:hypothetical protein
MKKFRIYFTFIFVANICLAGNFKITPILLNFKGVVAVDSITVAYADFGSALISRDYDKSWEQKKIFEGGNIINVFINGSEMVAFNDRGEAVTSGNLGKDWSTPKKLEDSALAAIEYPGGYLIRMRNKLITITKEFNKTNELAIESKILQKIGTYYMPTYDKSLLFTGNNFIAEFDSSLFIRFGIDLKPVDTLSLLAQIDSAKYLSGYRMFCDSIFIYLKYAYSLKSLKASVFRTSDFKTIEKYIDCRSAADCYTMHKGKYFAMNIAVTDKKLMDITKLSNSSINVYFKESAVNGNKQYIVGDRKILEILDLNDSSVKVISDYSDLTYRNAPDRFGENSYIFYSGYSGGPAIYYTENNGNTILPVVDKTIISYDKNFSKYNILSKYYDKETGSLYLLGDPFVSSRAVLCKSDDKGRSFDTTYFEGYTTISNGLDVYFRNAYVIPNIQKRGDEFISSFGYNKTPWGSFRSTLYTFKDNSKIIKFLIDSNHVFTHIYSRDTITYLAHSCNTMDSTSEVIYSDNGGNSWQTIHKYPINETIGSIYDIKVRGKEYMLISHYDYTNYYNTPRITDCFLDVIDKETNQFTRIASWTIVGDIFSIAIDSDGDKAYISIIDTLFVTNELFNKRNWNYYLLPEGGHIASPMKKFGDKFYCEYSDKNNPYGTGMHWIEPLDSLILGVGEASAEIDYIYAYPPYPNPAKNRIKSLIYWDSSIDYESIEISIYNIYGEKISSNDMITFEPVNAYSGYMTWDCSSNPPGVYLIHIKSINKSMIRKVILEK